MTAKLRPMSPTATAIHNETRPIRARTANPPFTKIEAQMFSFTTRPAGRQAKVLLTVSAVFGVGILCIGIFPGFDGFLLGLVLIGCCSATMFPLMINLIFRHFPSEKLGIATGSYETVFSLGSAMGPILAGSLALFASVRWAFVLFSLFGAVMFLFVTIGKSPQS